MATQEKAQLQLEVAINLGHRRYMLRVYRHQCISARIKTFLHSHSLSQHYHDSILKLIRDELRNKTHHFQREYEPKFVDSLENQDQSSEIFTELEEVSKIKEEIENKKQQIKEIPFQSNKQNKYESNKTERQQNSINREKQSEMKCLYEKWKAKQKEKSKQVTPKTNKPKVKQVTLQNVKKKPEAHDPSYFYRKGLKFNTAKQQHLDTLFQQQYPFSTTRNTSLTAQKKKELHDRLYHESRSKRINRIKTNISQRQHKTPPKPYDEIKKKVKQRDDRMDNKLNELLEKGLVKNSTTIEVIEKKPFRKTIVF